ncbi:MAG: PEP-CTERM sorting domain-containing protein [Betaproteobacteria bacterium]
MRPLQTLLAAALVTATAAAGAATVDVQFSRDAGHTQTGAAIVGSAGDLWNNFLGNQASGVALFDTTGAASGVSLSFSSYGVYESDPGYTQFTGTPYANLMQGYLYSFTDTIGIDLKFSGLVAGQEYGFVVYTQGDDNAGNRSIGLSANGGSQHVATQTDASTFVPGNNYTYIVTTADANGVVDIFGQDLRGEANLNGVQMMAVPEPSAMVLLMAGFMFLAGAVVRKTRVR